MCLLILLSLEDVLVYALMIGIYLAFPAFFALLGYTLIRNNNKARELTRQWAEENGCQLMEFSWQWSKGPFTEWRRRGDSYYRFAVMDKRGQKRTGWVRYFTRIFGDWDQDIVWTENTAEK